MACESGRLIVGMTADEVEIVKTQDFDAKDEVTDPDPRSNPYDATDATVLEGREEDPILEEFMSPIGFCRMMRRLISWSGRQQAPGWS